MSNETGVQYGAMETKTVRIDSNLDGKEYYAVDLDASEDVTLVNLVEDGNSFPYVLVEGGDGSANEKQGTIALSGRAKVKAGGTIAPGDKLTATTGGKWIKTTTDDEHYGAVALEIGASDDVIEVNIERGMVSGAGDD